MEKTNIVSNEIREEKVPKSHETADFGQEGAAPAARGRGGGVCGWGEGSGGPPFTQPPHTKIRVVE